MFWALAIAPGLSAPIAQAEPLAARELLWQFLELGNNVLGRCDDSSGLIDDRFRRAIGQLGRIIEAAQPNPATLAEQVFEAFCDNGYGVFDGVIQQLKQALGPEGLKSLKSRFEQWAEQPVPVPPRQGWQQVGWSSGGPSYAHEQAESSRQWTLKQGLQEVATATMKPRPLQCNPPPNALKAHLNPRLGVSMDA
jgi:hypothetical protein